MWRSVNIFRAKFAVIIIDSHKLHKVIILKVHLQIVVLFIVNCTFHSVRELSLTSVSFSRFTNTYELLTNFHLT